MTKINTSDLFVTTKDDSQIFIKRLQNSSSKIPLLLVHGSMENGRIFYSQSLKGFAPFMARNGFDVFVVDLRGKGQSRPRISKDFNFNQLDVINDLQGIFNKVKSFYPEKKLVIGTHSWGGVLVNSFLLRYTDYINQTQCIFHFGTKRSISVKNLQKLINIHIGFNFIMKLQAQIFGYVAPHFFGIDSEAKNYHLDQIDWINPKSMYKDPNDSFDYFQSARTNTLPRSLFMCGANDQYLGHIIDSKKYMKECNIAGHDLWYLSLNNGYSLDYGHNNMITSKESELDIHSKLILWIGKSH